MQDARDSNFAKSLLRLSSIVSSIHEKTNDSIQFSSTSNWLSHMLSEETIPFIEVPEGTSIESSELSIRLVSSFNDSSVQG
jgi:hypothetical protein